MLIHILTFNTNNHKICSRNQDYFTKKMHITKLIVCLKALANINDTFNLIMSLYLQMLKYNNNNVV